MYQSDVFEFIVLYGQRHIGKTMGKFVKDKRVILRSLKIGMSIG